MNVFGFLLFFCVFAPFLALSYRALKLPRQLLQSHLSRNIVPADVVSDLTHFEESGSAATDASVLQLQLHVQIGAHLAQAVDLVSGLLRLLLTC